MSDMQPVVSKTTFPSSGLSCGSAFNNRDDTFGGLQLSLTAEAREPPMPSPKAIQKFKPWQLSPSTLSKDGSITKVPGGAVKNTFIDMPATPWTPAIGGCMPCFELSTSSCTLTGGTRHHSG